MCSTRVSPLWTCILVWGILRSFFGEVASIYCPLRPGVVAQVGARDQLFQGLRAQPTPGPCTGTTGSGCCQRSYWGLRMVQTWPGNRISFTGGLLLK